MSDSGEDGTRDPGSPDASPAPEPARPRSRRRVLLAAGVALAVLAAAALAIVLTSGGEPATKEPSYPKAWDARILPYVKVVEKVRKHPFKHPIRVEFLSDEKFRKELLGDEEGPTAKERKELDQEVGMLRSIGLLTGKVDLFKASRDLAGVGVAAYYDPEDKQIRVRGTELTPAIESTLVHELTHGLQDQYFDIGARSKKLEKRKDDASEGFDALVEGDASRTETEYADSLSKAARAALEKSQKADEAGYEKAKSADIPPILETFVGASYALGEALLSLAAQRGGNDAVDDLFSTPPASEEHLIDPWTLVADEEKPVKVAVPELEDGEKKLDSGTFGEMTWLLMLAERVPLLTALDAADGWGGDSYLELERDGTTCVRVAYVGDSDLDATELRGALQRWIAASKGVPAHVEGTGKEVRFESCDPGAGAPAGSNSSSKALELAVTRTYLASSVLDGGASDDQARCFADGLVHSFSLAQLSNPDLGSRDRAVQARISSIAQRCR